MSAAREQALNASTNEQLNESYNGNNLSLISEDDEHTAIPKPNYEAKKPEDVFLLDESKNSKTKILFVD